MSFFLDLETGSKVRIEEKQKGDSLKTVSSNSDHVTCLKKPQRFLPIKREPFNQIDGLVITVRGGGKC